MVTNMIINMTGLSWHEKKEKVERNSLKDERLEQ
jgi:hypothetical protein